MHAKSMPMDIYPLLQLQNSSASVGKSMHIWPDFRWPRFKFLLHGSHVLFSLHSIVASYSLFWWLPLCNWYRGLLEWQSYLHSYVSCTWSFTIYSNPHWSVNGTIDSSCIYNPMYRFLETSSFLKRMWWYTGLCDVKVVHSTNEGEVV